MCLTTQQHLCYKVLRVMLYQTYRTAVPYSYIETASTFVTYDMCLARSQGYYRRCYGKTGARINRTNNSTDARTHTQTYCCRQELTGSHTQRPTLKVQGSISKSWGTKPPTLEYTNTKPLMYVLPELSHRGKTEKYTAGRATLCTAAVAA